MTDPTGPSMTDTTGPITTDTTEPVISNSSAPARNGGKRRLDLTLAVAFAALVLAAITFYFQFLHVRDANIVVISDKEEQGTVPRPYHLMPASSQADFPRYEEKFPLYALVRLVFANTGDCPGFVRIIDPVRAIPDGFVFPINQKPAMANYTYALVPPHSIVDRAIMLRNIPPVTVPSKVRLSFTVETGGSCDKTPTQRRELQMTAVLYPAADTRMVTSTPVTPTNEAPSR